MTTTSMGPSTGPRRQARSELTRERILEAAVAEFAGHGFEAASTRGIAARAGAHQPQINYHFDSKEALWRAAVDHVFALLDTALEPVGASPTPRDALEATIRSFVRFAAEHPELNRIMAQEGTEDSERLAWIVEHHIARRYDELGALLDAAGPGVVATSDPLILFYTLIGAASWVYVAAPEARRVTGREPTEADVIAAHADTLVAMFLTPVPQEAR